MAVLAVLALLASLVGAPGAAIPAGAVADGGPADGTTAASSLAGPTSGLAAQQSVDPDDVRVHVTVRPDGTAEWTVEYRLRLENESQVEGFESLREDVESNASSYRSSFVDVVSPSVERAAAETGREMTLQNASVATDREPLAGVVSYRFEWTNFAAVDGDRLLVGDALSGFYVDERTTLRVDWPAGYEAASVTPAPDDRADDAATWHGRTDFGADEPWIELTPAGGDLPLRLVAVAAVLLAATLGVVGLVRAGIGPSSDGDVAADATAGDEAGAAGDDAVASDGTDDQVPMELLSNEERVVAILEERGGRMKQQAIADALDWDDSKTSRVVTELREAEAVEVFRIGRENVVTLPEEELL
jgi:hypothetical protein